MANVQVMFSIPESTIPKLNGAVQRRGGRCLTMAIPVYNETIPDPAWQELVDNGSGVMTPNPVPQGQVPNPVTIGQHVMNLFVALGNQLVDEDIVTQGDQLKTAALAQHEVNEEANRQTFVEQTLSAVDRNISVSLQ